MGLDITIKERKEFRCPDCGRLVTTQNIGAECSGGRVWYNFLEPIGYYVPYEKRTDENDWYGKDFEAAILKIPVADVIPVRNGRWEERDDGFGGTYYHCSVCGEDWCTIEGTPAENGMRYCPQCGARMDGDADE